MPAGDQHERAGSTSQGPTDAATRFRVGARVSCSDGVCGKLAWVVVDPVARALTHLVVDPDRGRGLARLVPVELAQADAGHVALRCTLEQFEQLDYAEETRFLPASNDAWGYTSGQAFAWPYYGLGMGGLGLGGLGMGATPVGGIGGAHARRPVISDRVPLGEVEVHRGDTVHATDGEIGSVQGLVVEPEDHHVTHVLLQEGHLWGRKQVAIPIGAVTVADGIRVALTKQEVHDLPPVDLRSDPSGGVAPPPEA